MNTHFLQQFISSYSESGIYKNYISLMPFPFNGIYISLFLLVNFLFLILLDIVEYRKYRALVRQAEKRRYAKKKSREIEHSINTAKTSDEENVITDEYSNEILEPDEEEETEEIPSEFAEYEETDEFTDDFGSFFEDDEPSAEEENGFTKLLDKISRVQSNQVDEERKKEQLEKEKEENAARLDEEIRAKYKTDKISRKHRKMAESKPQNATHKCTTTIPETQKKSSSSSKSGIKGNTVSDIDIL